MTHEAAEVTKDTTGILGWIIGLGTYLIDKLQLMSINDLLTGISITVGIVWAIFKIIDTRLSIKIKKQTLKDNEQLGKNL